MSSYNTRDKVLRITRRERRNLYKNGPETMLILVRYKLADVVICNGRIIKNRVGTQRIVPHGHGDVMIAIERDWLDEQAGAFV